MANSLVDQLEETGKFVDLFDEDPDKWPLWFIYLVPFVLSATIWASVFVICKFSNDGFCKRRFPRLNHHGNNHIPTNSEVPAAGRSRHQVDVFDGRSVKVPAWEPHPWLRHVTLDPINGYNLIDLKWQRLKTLIIRITFRRWIHNLLQQTYVFGGTNEDRLYGRSLKDLHWPKSRNDRNVMG